MRSYDQSSRCLGDIAGQMHWGPAVWLDRAETRGVDTAKDLAQASSKNWKVALGWLQSLGSGQPGVGPAAEVLRCCAALVQCRAGPGAERVDVIAGW